MSYIDNDTVSVVNCILHIVLPASVRTDWLFPWSRPGAEVRSLLGW